MNIYTRLIHIKRYRVALCAYNIEKNISIIHISSVLIERIESLEDFGPELKE